MVQYEFRFLGWFSTEPWLWEKGYIVSVSSFPWLRLGLRVAWSLGFFRCRCGYFADVARGHWVWNHGSVFFFSLLIFCTTFAVAVFVVMGLKSNILHHLLSDHVANQKHTNLNQNSKHRGEFQALERFWNYALGRDRVFLKRNVVEIFFTWRLPLFDGRSFV